MLLGLATASARGGDDEGTFRMSALAPWNVSTCVPRSLPRNRRGLSGGDTTSTLEQGRD